VSTQFLVKAVALTPGKTYPLEPPWGTELAGFIGLTRIRLPFGRRVISITAKLALIHGLFGPRTLA
jgi:hypothetical protein